MRTLLFVLLWFVLLALCWPLALLFLVAFPFIWLLLLPFRIIGFTLGLAFKIISGIVLLPFRILKLA